VSAQARLAVGSAALLAAVAALVAAAWLLAGRRDEAARQAREDARPLAIAPAGVVEVLVEGGAGPAAYRLSRGRPAWRISPAGSPAAAGAPSEAPPGAPADAEAVERLLAELAGLRPRTEIREPLPPLPAVGLEPPRARVTLVLERGSRLVLELGDEHPFDRSVHARVRSEGRPAAPPAGILLLPPGSRERLAPDPSSLRADAGR
jgi:hypothetical protein